MSLSTFTVIMFCLSLAASVLYYRPKHEKRKAAQICFGVFIALMGILLGLGELFFVSVLGHTISQFEDMIQGSNAWLFNLTFFGAWLWLLVHFNAKRVSEWFKRKKDTSSGS